MLDQSTLARMREYGIRHHLRCILVVGVLGLLASGSATSQLSGSYDVGDAADAYTTIEAAIADLVANGVSGPVTFRLEGKTYTPPTGGYVLPEVASMSSTNTVTFKPKAGETVVIDGTLASAIITISGGDHYIVDGSNGVAATRDMKVINRNTGESVITFNNGATYNVVRNLHVIGTGTSSIDPVVKIHTTTGTANSYNTISSNLIGDTTGVLRATAGYYQYGSSSAQNSDNTIEYNDIVNFGTTSTGYGIYLSVDNLRTRVIGNRIRNTAKGSWSGASYGIYLTNSDSDGEVIAGNRIWDHGSTSSTATVYGIYISSMQASRQLDIVNNMVAIATTGSQTASALHVSTTASGSTVRAYYNALSVTGLNAGTSSSYGVYQSSSINLTLKNNIIVNTRVGTGTATNRAIHRNGTTGTLASDHNSWYYGSGASSAMGYSTSAYSTLATWQALGHDANSVQGDPQFVDAANGDLHISTTSPTPVEGKGTPITTWTDDYDGDTRSTTRPDIGADEGTFMLLRNNDLEASSILMPYDGALLVSNTAFTPLIAVTNSGVNTQAGVPVRVIIRDASSVVVYEDVQASPSIASGGRTQMTFPQTGGISGSTSLGAGVYTVELRTELTGDDDNTNDTMTATFDVKDAFSGTYTIDRSGSGSRNYPSFTSAIAEMRILGLQGATTFLVAGGTYTSASETLPITIGGIAGVDATNTLTFRPAAGATVTITGTVSGGIIELDGADYVTLDGSNTAAGVSRDWTLVNLSTSQPTLLFENGATHNTVRNMVMMGSSTSSSDGIVNIASTTTGVGNSYNVVAANTLGDPTGTIRSTTAIRTDGSTSAQNIGNAFDDNDIVNFSTGTSTAYGIYIDDESRQTRIANNRMSIPTKSGSTSSSVYGIYWSNGDTERDTIIGNRIFDLQTSGLTDTYRAIYISTVSTTEQPAILNNMITLVQSGAATISGIYISTGNDTAHIYNNTIVIGGSNGGSAVSYGVYLTSTADAFLKGNIIVNERTGTSVNNRAIYRSGTSGFLVSDENVLYASGTGTAIGYAGTNKVTLSDWQSAGYDAASFSQRPAFVDEANGDLHLDHVVVPFKGEGMAGVPSVPVDIDGEARDAVISDIGADEGDFNGGGLALQYPNGGEQFPVNADIDVLFTANRALPAYVEFSSDNGETWSHMATIDRALVGENSTTINLPDIEMTTARVRVISQRNAYEADTSDASFSLMRPVFVILAPNGGERLVPTDTARIRWTARFMPSSSTVSIEHSTDGGATWAPIATGLAARNLPDTNVFDWTVPDLPGPSNLVRVLIPRSRSVDVSNAPFEIQLKPSVTLSSLNDGGRYFAGETATVRWSTVNTRNVRLEYSIDGGASWRNVLAGGKVRIGASIGSYEWTIPAVNSPTALVRVVNDERTRFVDVSDETLEIVIGRLAVVTPNGQEKYELSEPVTVRFDAPHSQTLRVDYSFDGGVTWQTVAQAIDASLGSYTFTPPGIPTPRALVRLVDESRVALQDASDGFFEIMQARSITIFTPAQGERVMRSTTYPITWQAIRIARVNIDYSPNGGASGSWVRVASNIEAGAGTFNWSVPALHTDMGVIRISEVGGPVVGETGQFSIVAPVTSVRLLRPNGGETYTAGDAVVIGWTSANIATVSLEYTSDGGATWTAIASNVAASQATYQWRAPETASTQYRVRVTSGALSDMSDRNFEVRRRLTPSVTVQYPNGGESLEIDSTVQVRWTSQDIAGPVGVSYSLDNGSTWVAIGTADVASQMLSWTVPAALSQQALVKVEAADGITDVSDAVFSIVAPVVPAITLNTPNSSSVVWREAEEVTVTWTTQNVATVSVELSVDDGQTWTQTIATGIDASLNTVTWRVPHLADTTLRSLRVRVMSTDDATVSDTSDESFTFEPVFAGVEEVTTGASGLRLSGAYPNPFTSQTELRWQQSTSGMMELRVYSASGVLVHREGLGQLEAGEHRARINGVLLPAGVYIYELRTPSAAVRGTVTLVH